MHNKLLVEIEVSVKFSEVDALGIVWHGHYIRYFEDGREAFGNKYGIGYMDVFDEGFTTPLIHVDCKFKKSLKYGDRFIVQAKFCPMNVPKIRFEYTILSLDRKNIISVGSTEQVFLDKSGNLQLVDPVFFESWKKKWLMS